MKFIVNSKIIVICIIIVIISESCAKPVKSRNKKRKPKPEPTTPPPETTTPSTTAKPDDLQNKIGDPGSIEDQSDFELLNSLKENTIQEQSLDKKLANQKRIDENSDQENEILPQKNKEQVQQLEDKNPGNLIDQKLPSGPNDKLSPPGVIVPENQKHPDHQNEEVFQGIFNNEATPSPGKNPDDKVKDLGQNSKETPGADHQKISHNDLNLEDGLDNTEHHNSDGNLKNRDQTSENSLDASLHTLHEDLNLKDVLDDSDRHNLVLDDDTRNQHEHQDETQDNLHQGYKEIPGVQEELIVPSKYPTTKTDQQDTINYPFVSTSTHYPDTFETPENQIHPYLYPQMGPPYPDTFEAPENNQINPHLYPQMTPPYPDPLGLPEHNQIYPYQNPHLGYQNYLDDFQNQLPFNSYAPQFPYYQDPYTYYQNPFSFYQNPYQNDFLSQYHPRNFYNPQTTRWQKFKNFMQKPINSLKHHFNNLSDKVKNWFKPNKNDQDQVESKSLTLKDFADPQIVQRFLENLSQVLDSIRPAVSNKEVVNYAKKILDTIADNISTYIMPK